jgi:hypothetical protein
MMQAETVLGEGALRLVDKLFLDECDSVLHGAEILRSHFVISNCDFEAFLKKNHQFYNPGRINDIPQ